MAGLFDGIGDVEENSRIYFETGSYVVEILNCTSGVSTFKQMPFFAVEVRVLQTSNPAHPVGSKGNWFVKLAKGRGRLPALANIRRFVSIATDTPFSDVDDAGTEMVVSKEQPLTGTVLKLTTVKKKLDNGNDFTVHQFEKYEGDVESLKRKVG